MDVSPSPFGAPSDDDDDEVEVEVEVEVEDNEEEEDDDEDVFCGFEDDEAVVGSASSSCSSSWSMLDSWLVAGIAVRKEERRCGTGRPANFWRDRSLRRTGE